MITVIGFDLDDTLWEVAPIIHRAERVLNTWLQTAAPTLKYDTHSMRELRHHVLGEDPGMANQITELRRRIIERALELSNIANAHELSQDAIEVFLHERNQIDFFEGAKSVLEHLAGDYILGALSNGNADIHRLGLSELFSFAFSAEQVGAPKPAPNLFTHALHHVGIEPGQMVYVGDDPALDVDAAKRLGIRAIWLDHGRKPPGDHEPDVTIKSIRELPAAIDTLNSGAG